MLAAERWTREVQPAPDERFEVIVHCAYNARKDVSSDELAGYMDDNVLLTERLAARCTGKLVLMSSISVYPPGDRLRREDERIELGPELGLYGICKLMSEAIVRSRGPDHLILRLGSLLGPHSRDNVTLGLIRGTRDVVPLQAGSRFLYARYRDVEELIRAALAQDLCGTFNVAAAEPVTLEEVARICGASPRYGEIAYDAGRVDNRRAAALVPALGLSSRELLERYLAEASETGHSLAQTG